MDQQILMDQQFLDAPANPDVSADAANVVTVDESFPSPVDTTRRNVDCSWEEVQRIDQQLQHG